MNGQKKDIYYYQSASVKDLSSELTKAMRGMEQDGDRYVKSGAVNTIFVVRGDYDREKTEDLINTFTLAHPNRAFLVVIDEEQQELKAEFSARCHKVSQNEHVCSEVIRLSAKEKNLTALKSVIRANLLTGMNTELVLFNGKNFLQEYENFAELSEQLIFTSADFADKFQDLSELLSSRLNLVDLEWIKLGTWRDQIKEIFDLPLARESLHELKAVNIIYSGSASSAKLLSGWIFDRLRNAYNEPQRLLYQITEGGDKDGLCSLTLSFQNSEDYIQINHADLLESEISLGVKIRTTRVIEDLSDNELLKRFFLVGESTCNYRSSLAGALKLDGILS